jgi:hypothetical protein
MILKGLYQFVQVTAHCVANHTFLSILLQFTRLKGLGKTTDDNGFEGWELVKVGEEGVVRALMDGHGQMGKPLVPDTSLVCFDLWHNLHVMGNLCKVELIHKVIALGRGAM